MTKKEIANWIIRVLKRILVEFSIPAIAATIWYFTTTSPTLKGWGLFFVSTSWVSSQIFRIIKQQRVEGEFDLVKSRLGDMVDKIEEQTKKLIGYSTGGDSKVSLTPSIPYRTNFINIDIHNNCEFPVFDIWFEHIDLNEKGVNPQNGIWWTRHNLMIGDIYPQKIKPGILKFDMTNRNELRINIFLNARNHNSTYQFKVLKLDGQFKIAYQERVGEEIHNHIPNDFPNYDEMNPNEIFK